jgi:hypothetical protein
MSTLVKFNETLPLKVVKLLVKLENLSNQLNLTADIYDEDLSSSVSEVDSKIIDLICEAEESIDSIIKFVINNYDKENTND